MLTLVIAKGTVGDPTMEKRRANRFAFLSERAPQARLDLGDKRTELHPIIDFSRTGMALDGTTECAVGDTGRVKLAIRSGKRNRYTDVGQFTVCRAWPETGGGLAIELSEPEEAWLVSLPEA
jgi:hypothetical protein